MIVLVTKTKKETSMKMMKTKMKKEKDLSNKEWNKNFKTKTLKSYRIWRDFPLIIQCAIILMIYHFNQIILRILNQFLSMGNILPLI